MSVIEAVMSFDGTHVDELKAAAKTFAPDEGPALLALCSIDDPQCRVGATWLVKAVLEDGRGETLELGAYFSCLDAETEWGALLHILQSVKNAPQTASHHRGSVEALLDHNKTLVSVWALDALVHIVLETNDGLADARRRVEAALGHEKASMRARARHLAPSLGL